MADSQLLLKNGRTPFLARTVLASWVILFACCIFQIVFYPDIVNLVALATVIVSWALVVNMCFKTHMLEKYLISTFALIGFCLSQCYLPVLFTTLENKPVVYNLEMPEEVFLHIFLCLVVLLAAHVVYRYSRRLSLGRSVSLLSRVGLFTPPTHLQVWIMGFIGMASSFYVYFTSPDIGREITGAAEDKLLQGLVPFTYAPFLIMVSKLYGNDQKLHKGYLPLLFLYAVALFAVSIARNSRGAFIFGLTTPVFAYGIGLLLGIYKTKILTFRNVAVAAAIAWVLLGPFTDLGTAMLIVRGQRTDMSPAELISSTIETLDDKRAIETRKKEDLDMSMDWDWDERYLDNLFTARFANIKFNDSNLITSSKVGMYDPVMQEYSLDAFISILPEPVIQAFGMDVDKDVVLSMSFGDFMYVLSGGHGTPEGYRIGHVSGTGLATFGWWYLALLAVMAIPSFYLIDKLVKIRPLDDGENTSAVISMCGILFLTHFYYFFMVESVVQLATYLIRGWIQMIILYVIIYQISLPISRLVEPRRRHRFSPIEPKS